MDRRTLDTTSRTSTPRPAGSRFKDAPSRPGGAGRAPAAGTYRPSSYGAQGTPRPAHRAPVQTQRPYQGQGYRAAVHGRPAPKKSSPVPVIIAVAVAIVAIAGILLFALPVLFGSSDGASSVEPGQSVQVTIPEGASGDQIASALSEAHVIDDPKDYYAAVKSLQADMQLKPGTYEFTTGQDPTEVVRQLMAGPNVDDNRLTVPEGLSVTQTAARVEEAFGIPADDFIAQAKASNYAADYPFLAGVANDSLEGYLCPKTYSFLSAPTADEVIRAMLDQYRSEVAGLDFDAARSTISSRYGIDMSDYDFVILASVIEREALTDDQRYNVSSAFYNRLEQGMALQSDATMMYVTGGEVTADDLKTESPYNTYLNTGLPPTPICTPSLASLSAALDPAETDYLYFFITQDTEYFSETYDQHLKAIEENR